MKPAPQSPSVSNPKLENTLEPLANYICAADRPVDVLEAIWSALLKQVAETNRTAKLGIAHFLEYRTQVNI